MIGETTYQPPAPEPAPSVATNTPYPSPKPAAPSKTAKKPPSGRAGGGGGGGGAGRSVAAEESWDGDDGTYGAGDYGGYTEDEAPVGIDADTLRRSTLAQAKAATVSGQTRFELADRVTVPEGTSTMVAIVNADVDGEETFLFRPGGAGYGYEMNPYRVVRFKNSTPFVLEPGPIGIYAGGSFVGEGLSETVGAATSATIPFAVETNIMVTSKIDSDRDEQRLIKMSRGVLEVEQFARRTTIYTAQAQTGEDAFTVLIRHSKAGGAYVLANKPEGTEELPDAYLVRLNVAAGKHDGSLTIVEQTPARMQISIWNSPALDILEKLILSADLDRATIAKLKPIIDKRRAVAKLEEQIAGLTEKRNKLDQRANELRQNLVAIAKNPRAGEQRDKWTKQLDEFGSEGNKIGAQLADLEAKKLDLRVQLEDSLEEFELIPPQPKKP
jgi:hypothetical protein